MALEDGEIGWFSPDPRGVLPLDESGFRVPHGLRRTLKHQPFEMRVDTAFRTVMEYCAARDETWINSVILESYCVMHAAGHAHSVEAWQDGELVGGLYGVAIGSAFFGESMFHSVTDASKVALVFLVQRLRERGYQLLDLQWTTPHLCTFGAVNIPRQEYLERLANALRYRCVFG
ncbi:leucyl/phenylalanyl-tRNA--protein transferase [Verrucomicrobia bacterium SCGC AG-212-E04]|nr:leucyl/phenylalanyl-tRNA--protein transferase [Verrucomicrobia bacterium SCGC AG-212-E04]